MVVAGGPVRCGDFSAQHCVFVQKCRRRRRRVDAYGKCIELLYASPGNVAAVVAVLSCWPVLVCVCVCAYCNEHNRNSESGFGHIGIHFINLISDKVQTDKRRVATAAAGGV